MSRVGKVRGSHFMMCVENVADRETKALFPEAANAGKCIWGHCQPPG